MFKEIAFNDFGCGTDRTHPVSCLEAEGLVTKSELDRALTGVRREIDKLNARVLLTQWTLFACVLIMSGLVDRALGWLLGLW